ncbi:MAG: hypothetical protein E7117_09605 [Bacteroidales bacterium]|nr:hypothetical protein [Bacteroidales bacterium]
MRRILYMAVALWVVLAMFPSCRAISSFLGEDEAVAQVGSRKLYRSEIDKVVPKGMSPQDSALLAGQYIMAWASDQVFLDIAQEQLSKSEKDVSKELEEYRRSLLKYRYEQLYVNERLDTTVSEESVRQYYADHPDKFVLARPVLKARYLKIASDSPVLSQIRKRMASSDAKILYEADSLAYSSALKYTTWDERWIDVIVLAREFHMDHASLLKGMDRNGWIETKDTLGHTNLAYVSEIAQAGTPTPLEYCGASIRDMIISTRKQALINSLERDLLDDARDNGKFVIF